MFDFAPGIGRGLDRIIRPVLRFSHVTLGLVLSVVYGQFHYAVDAVAGLIVACAVLASLRIYGTAPAGAPAPLAEQKLETGPA